jgi:hypothetical protein
MLNLFYQLQLSKGNTENEDFLAGAMMSDMYNTGLWQDSDDSK